MISKKFNEAFSKVGDDLSALDWLYENAPDFVLKKLTNSVLWEDLKKLLLYDKNKWFVDSSTTMIKAIRAIISKEGGLKFLYNQFESNPSVIKEIYHFLDKNGKSELYNGKKIPNKTIFSSLLTRVVNHDLQGFQNKDRIRTDVTFRITEGYRVDSNVKIGNDKFKGRYDLTQERLHTKRVTENIGGFMDGTASQDYVTYDKEIGWLPEGETHSLHPLDIVTFIMPGENGEDLALPMPVIFVKDLAHQREWEEIQQIIRIGADILAVALGIVVLATSGNPGIIALAVADIGLAGTDIFVQVSKDALMQTKEGQEFLRQWERIYTIGGVAIATVSAPQLIQSTLNLGGSLYRLAKGTTREFLKNVITKVILEINIANFTGKTVKFLDNALEVITVSKKALTLKKAEKLQRLGVLFVEGVTEAGQKELGLIYKGEVIATGTGKQLKETLKDVLAYGAKEDDIVRALDGLVFEVKNLRTGSGGFLKYNKTLSRNMIRQEEPMSCAAACLKQLADDKGLIYTEKEIRNIVDTDFYRGTDNLDLLQGAQKIFGESNVTGQVWYTRGVSDKTTFVSRISELDSPFITSIASSSGNKHSIIVDKIAGNNVHIRDPWPLEGVDKSKLLFDADDRIIPKSVKWLGNSGVEGIANLDDFIQQWAFGGNVIIKIK